MLKNLLILAAMATCGCAEHYSITGTLHADTADSVYLYTESHTAPLASAPIDQDGAFTLQGDVKSPLVAQLTARGEVLTMLFLEEGDIHITPISRGRLLASGTATNDKLCDLNNHLDQLLDSEYTLGLAAADSLATCRKELIAKTISTNVDNPLGAWLFANWELPTLTHQQARERLTEFPKSLRRSPTLARVATDLEASDNTDIGALAPELALPDTSRVILPLTAYCGNGRWLLIHFWASWDQHSVRQIAQFKRIHDQYKESGFTIYGISLDNDMQAWRQCLIRHLPPWPNTSGIEKGKSPAAKRYGVKSIPCNFLIAPNGCIAAKNISCEELLRQLSASCTTIER